MHCADKLTIREKDLYSKGNRKPLKSHFSYTANVEKMSSKSHLKLEKHQLIFNDALNIRDFEK